MWARRPTSCWRMNAATSSKPLTRACYTGAGGRRRFSCAPFSLDVRPLANPSEPETVYDPLGRTPRARESTTRRYPLCFRPMALASTSRSTLGLAALIALLAGCFTEPDEGTTTGSSCDPGSFGCECLGGVCEPDLECTASNVCIPEDCTPGTAICGCDAQGRCGPGLECTNAVCVPTGGTSVGTSDTEGTSTSTSTSTPPTTSTTDGSDSTTESVDTSTTDHETSTGPSETTGMPMECNDRGTPPSRIACNECFACTHNEECEAAFLACEDVLGCPTIASCMRTCAVSGLCSNCCSGETQQAVVAAELLQACREDACIEGVCESYSGIVCNN